MSTANSIVGTHPDDWVGVGAIATSDDGDYLLFSSEWSDGTDVRGAITHVDGTRGNAEYTIDEPIHYPFAYSSNALLQYVNLAQRHISLSN